LQQQQEEFSVGKYRIKRDHNSYIIARGRREYMFTRFHSAIQALSDNLDIYYFKGDYSRRLLAFESLPKNSDDLEPLVVDTKLSAPVTWGSAVAGSAAGMIFASIIKDVWRMERKTIKQIAALVDDMSDDTYDEVYELVSLMRDLSPTDLLARAIQDRFNQTPEVTRTNAGVNHFAKVVGAKAAIQIASVEGRYMRQAGSVGTIIHSILELVARNAMDVDSIQWPMTLVKSAFVNIDDDLIERARITWISTVSKLKFRACDILAVEPIIIVNHSGEKIAGAADLVLLLNGEIVIVDWKTSRKMTSRADYAIQVATYSLASRILCDDGDIVVSHPDVISRQQRQQAQDEMTRLLVAGEIDEAVEIANEIQENLSLSPVDRSVATLPDGSVYPMAKYAVLVRVDSVAEATQAYRVDISGSIREFVLRLLRANEVVTEAKLPNRVRQIRDKKPV
jgi:hypothetical protein